MSFQVRPDTVAPLIAAGKELFCDQRVHFPFGVPRYNVLGWLFDVCADASVQLNMLEREHVVGEVLAAANQVVSSPCHYLTVGALRNTLRNLPENMPVFYERINDSHFKDLNWKSHLFVSESRLAEQVDRDAVATGKYPLYRIAPSPEGDLAQELLEGIGAFTAFVQSDDEGRKALIITAHY